MKIKGKRGKVQQVTFVGDKHPSTGCTSVYTWQRLAAHLEKKNKTKVISLQVTESGLQVWWGEGNLLGMCPEL